MYDTLAYRHFFLNAYHLIFAVAIEQYDVVNARTVEQECLLALFGIYFQRRAYKSLVAVDIEFFGRFGHVGGLDAVKISYDCLPRICGSVFLLKMLKPTYGVFGQRIKIALQLFDPLVECCNSLIGRLRTKTQYAAHLYFKQPEQIVVGNLTEKFLLPWLQTPFYMPDSLVLRPVNFPQIRDPYRCALL